MQIRLLCLAAAVAVTGCASGPEPLRTEKVEVPVSTPCVDAVPARPDLIAEKVWAQTTSEFDRQRALRVDRERLVAHVTKLEATLTACVKK